MIINYHHTQVSRSGAQRCAVIHLSISGYVKTIARGHFSHRALFVFPGLLVCAAYKESSVCSTTQKNISFLRCRSDGTVILCSIYPLPVALRCQRLVSRTPVPPQLNQPHLINPVAIKTTAATWIHTTLSQYIHTHTLSYEERVPPEHIYI